MNHFRVAAPSLAQWGVVDLQTLKETLMGKTGRKRRARRKNKANHGKRPNS